MRALLIGATLLAICIVTDACSGGGKHSNPPPTPSDFTLSLGVSSATVIQGASATIPVTVTRGAGAAAAVVVRANSLPSGVTAAPATIPADQTTASLALTTLTSTPQVVAASLLVVGSGGGYTHSAPMQLTIRGAPGAIDTTYGGGAPYISFSTAAGLLNSAVLDPTGRFLLAGSTVNVGGGEESIAVVAIRPDGAPDSTFASAGYYQLSNFGGFQDVGAANALLLEPDGKLLVGGQSYSMNPNLDSTVIRLGADGTPDGAFGTTGIETFDLFALFGHPGGDDGASQIMLNGDGSIFAEGTVATGGTGTFSALTKLTATGAVDTSFGTNGAAYLHGGAFHPFWSSVRRQSDGKFVAGGRVFSGGKVDGYVARFLSDGTSDAAFGFSGVVLTTSNAFGQPGPTSDVAILPDGRILALQTASTATAQSFTIARLETSGALDTTFASNGFASPRFGYKSEVPSAIAVSGNQVYVAGTVGNAGGPFQFLVARLTTNGAIDPTFGSNGVSVIEYAGYTQEQYPKIALQPDGRILLAGSLNNAGAGNDWAFVRLWP